MEQVLFIPERISKFGTYGGRIGGGRGGRGLSDEQDPGEKRAPHGVDRNTVSLRRVEQLRSRVRR